MSSPGDIDLDALPPAVRALIESERAARAELEQQVATLARHNERLEHLVREFRKALYGKRSEKLSADERQLAFEDLETALAAAEATKGAAEATTPGARREARAPAKRNLGRLPKELPRIEHVIEPAATRCSCGGAMTRIGEERTERLDIVPAKFRVIATVRPKYACRVCSGAVVQAAAPAHLIEGALPTEGLIAHVLVSKYADHVPLYRQAQIYGRAGLDLHRSTLADWVGKAAFHLALVVDRLARQLKGSTKLFMDETTAPVLDPGRGRTRTGCLWALGRQRPDGRGLRLFPPAVVRSMPRRCSGVTLR